MKRRLLLLGLVVLLVLGVVGASSGRSTPAVRIRAVSLMLPTGHRLALEVTHTPGRGLKGRRLRPYRGMLFVHPSGPPPRFTMAGVPERLAALHLDREGRLMAVSFMATCASPDWRRCPIYPAPKGTRITIEARPIDVRGIALGSSIVYPSLAKLLVR